MDRRQGHNSYFIGTSVGQGSNKKEYSERDQYTSTKYGKDLKEQAAAQIFYRI